MHPSVVRESRNRWRAYPISHVDPRIEAHSGPTRKMIEANTITVRTERPVRLWRRVLCQAFSLLITPAMTASHSSRLAS